MWYFHLGYLFKQVNSEEAKLCKWFICGKLFYALCFYLSQTLRDTISNNLKHWHSLLCHLTISNLTNHTYIINTQSHWANKHKFWASAFSHKLTQIFSKCKIGYFLKLEISFFHIDLFLFSTIACFLHLTTYSSLNRY